MYMLRVLIIGNSEFPKKEIIDDLIFNSDKIIACDGAIERCFDASITVDYVIGDMGKEVKGKKRNGQPKKLDWAHKRLFDCGCLGKCDKC